MRSVIPLSAPVMRLTTRSFVVALSKCAAQARQRVVNQPELFSQQYAFLTLLSRRCA